MRCCVVSQEKKVHFPWGYMGEGQIIGRDLVRNVVSEQCSAIKRKGGPWVESKWRFCWGGAFGLGAR